jgi:pimeloyl-ACP methyl ester carboxylesterase
MSMPTAPANGVRWSAVVAKLAAALPRAQSRVIAGAGHVPQATHPAEYAAAVTEFAAADTIGSG